MDFTEFDEYGYLANEKEPTEYENLTNSADFNDYESWTEFDGYDILL